MHIYALPLLWLVGLSSLCLAIDKNNPCPRGLAHLNEPLNAAMAGQVLDLPDGFSEKVQALGSERVSVHALGAHLIAYALEMGRGPGPEKMEAARTALEKTLKRGSVNSSGLELTFSLPKPLSRSFYKLTDSLSNPDWGTIRFYARALTGKQIDPNVAETVRTHLRSTILGPINEGELHSRTLYISESVRNTLQTVAFTYGLSIEDLAGRILISATRLLSPDPETTE